ncbi:hypothetical protein OSB04_001669 [Centaurea solstitialis]|uniref:DUF659 domain-containing protein n=1 Tax=Centaurea solstitialis TaxID=347529 RepID=A0AA38UA93_9ASTR|nr:hypothetical protein OSB04_001669 [Centaurea solstitialis]
MSSNPMQHQRTKHIEIDIHFVQDKVTLGHVRALHVPSSSQYADIFTKGLPHSLFSDFKSSLNIRHLDVQTAEGYFSSVEKTGETIAEFLSKAIESIGPSNVLSVMTDNAANYKAARKEVEKIVVKRWEKLTISLHCLGFALTPRFYDTHYLETVAPGGTRIKAPNLDVEVVQGVMDAFSRIAENKEEFWLLREQFAYFHTKKGLYSLPAAQMDVVIMEAIDWCLQGNVLTCGESCLLATDSVRYFPEGKGESYRMRLWDGGSVD